MSKPSRVAAHVATAPEADALGGVSLALALTPQQREKLQLLGGPAWMRDAIDKADLPSGAVVIEQRRAAVS